ncbi:MAG: tryptophan-rich sensory protein [Bacteroidetes bacterium]|nr:MAG: tryptophan-rich sensory protein [Bacteroidota bacterium]
MGSKTKQTNVIFASINLVLFIGVIVVNALASILPINGMDTGELSDLYPNLFVPAGLTFSIWGLIYLLLLGMVINQLVIAVREKTTGMLSLSASRVLGVNFLLNMAWILAWHYKLVGLSLLIMIGLLLTLIYLFREVDTLTLNNVSQKLLVLVPVSVYLGWISVATIANVTTWLVNMSWAGFGIAAASWTIVVVLVGGLLAVLMLRLRKSLAYAAVILWAYLGIVIKRMATEPVENGIIYTVYGVMAVIAIFMILVLITKRRRPEMNG